MPANESQRPTPLTPADLSASSRNGKFPKTIEIIYYKYYKSGNGHVSTAKALQEAIIRKYPDTKIILTDAYEQFKGASMGKREV